MRCQCQKRMFNENKMNENQRQTMEKNNFRTVLIKHRQQLVVIPGRRQLDVRL